MYNETPTDELLAPLSQELCKEREETIKGRKTAGLDAIWARAREQYQGIDEKNKSRLSGPLDGKATTLDGPIRTTMGRVNDEDRSTVFVNITAPYTDAGTARVADILLPTGKMPFDLKLTPISDIEMLRKVVEAHPMLLESLQMMAPDIVARLATPPEAAKAALEESKRIIEDWLKETDWLGCVREQIVESGKVGTGVLKGPFPKRRQTSEAVDQVMSILPMAVDADTAALLTSTLDMTLRFRPAVECIKVENCYPDPACGTDINNGGYFWERVPDYSKHKLESLLDDPSYFPEQIKACLEEGPEDDFGNKKDKKKSYDLWIRTGDVDLGKLGEIEEELLEFSTVVVCNKRIIKIKPTPLDKKVFGYWLLNWKGREDSWAGIGIPEQIETPQRGLNASVRAMNDNLAYSVGPQVLELDGLIEPAEGGSWRLTPYKRWKVKRRSLELDAVDPKQALQFLEFPNYSANIMPIIEYWLRMAEQTTGLPLLLQGQATSDAVGVNQQLQNNATSNLRLIVKAWDDKVCAPQIDCFYQWVQQYGPESARGDAVAESLGSSTLIVKELQQQALLQIGDRIVDPIYGKSPSKWMDIYLESFQIDPRQLDLTDEERQRLEAMANQPDPKEIVAQIQAETDLMIAKIRDATERMKLSVSAQLDGAQIDQARDAVETQTAAQIAGQVIKGEDDLTKEKVKQGAKPPPTNGAQAPAAAPPEMNVDDALSTLGIV